MGFINGLSYRQLKKEFGLPPTGAELKWYIETEMGSRYVVSGDYWSHRRKFDDTDHDWMKIGFIQPTDANRILEPRLYDHIRYAGTSLSNDSLLGIFTVNNHGSDPDITCRIQRDPAIGMAVIELLYKEGRLIRYHVGHKVALMAQIPRGTFKKW